MFLTDVLPTLSCLVVLGLAWMITSYADWVDGSESREAASRKHLLDVIGSGISQKDRLAFYDRFGVSEAAENTSAGTKTRVVVICIGLIMAMGIPIYFKATLEIEDYWTVPLIFFGSLLSLNAIRGICRRNLQAPVLGTAWWSFGLAAVIQFLLFVYGSHPNAFINPSIQTVGKVLIFILLALAVICFLYFLLFQRNISEAEYRHHIGQVGHVKKRLEIVIAYMGLIVTVAQIITRFINVWAIFGVR